MQQGKLSDLLRWTLNHSDEIDGEGGVIDAGKNA